MNKCWDHEPRFLAFLPGTPQLLKAQDFSRWPHYLLLLFAQLLLECPVVTVTLTRIDKLVGFAPGVSVARQAPPLIIMVWVLCVGSCLPVTSHTGPCLTASHSLESANWHDRTEYLSLAWPNQAKGPNYQIRILQAFSENLFFPALSRALTCLSHSSAYDIFT